ncbi:MAG: hypothetical protein QOJ17_1971, partial [Rhodospirillaceae bacterium]|nr:hypothetical protein [Rhodospirillaceae bacterium]
MQIEGRVGPPLLLCGRSREGAAMNVVSMQGNI